MQYDQAADPAALANHIDLTKEGKMQFRKMMAILFVGISTFVFAGNASANSTTPQTVQHQLRGQCGGAVSNWQEYLNNLSVYGAVGQAAQVNRSAGYSPLDGGYAQWLRDRVIVTRLAAPAVIGNRGCNSHGLFNAGTKYLPAGWPVLVALPMQYSKAGVSLTPKKGYRAIRIRVHLVAQATCTNPGVAVVVIIIYVPVAAAPTPRKPKKAPKRTPASFACIKVTLVKQSGADLVLQVVTREKGVKFVGVNWSLKPSSVVDKKTAQFHLTQTGLVTIVARPVWQVSSSRTVAGKCIFVASNVPTTVTVPVTPPTAACVTTAGVPLFPPLPSGITVVNGICTTVVTTTVQTCEANQTLKQDSNGNVVCINNSNTNIVTVPITVTVPVTVTTPPACTTCTTPPPCTTCTTAPSPPAIVSVTNPEETKNNGEQFTVCATVQVKSGDSITLLFSTDYGSFAAPAMTFTSTGTDQKCAVYTAPKDASVVGKNEVIHYNCIDNTTGARCAQVDSKPFPIKASASNPA